MGIFDLLFGSSNDDQEETVVVEYETGWTGTYPGPLTDEIAEIFEENGYSIVEEEKEEEEDTPWWKIW